MSGPVVAVGLVQSGGIAGRELSARLTLADLPAAAADRTRDLAEEVLAEPSPARGTPVYDGLEYELTLSRDGAPDQRIVTRDGALTPAQRALIATLRPHLRPT